MMQCDTTDEYETTDELDKWIEDQSKDNRSAFTD